MKKACNDTRARAEEQIEAYLEEAISGGADKITFEFVPEGLATCFRLGGTGARRVLRDYELGVAMMQRIVTDAGLKEENTGLLTWKINGKPVKFNVEEYKSFGENAFRFIVKSDGGLRANR